MQDEDNDELSPLVPFQFSSVPAELYITLWKGRERECVLSHRGSAEITFRRQNVEKALLRSANRQEQILPFSSASTNASMSFRWKTYGNSCRRREKKLSRWFKIQVATNFPFFPPASFREKRTDFQAFVHKRWQQRENTRVWPLNQFFKEKLKVTKISIWCESCFLHIIIRRDRWWSFFSSSQSSARERRKRSCEKKNQLNFSFFTFTFASVIFYVIFFFTFFRHCLAVSINRIDSIDSVREKLEQKNWSQLIFMICFFFMYIEILKL